MDLCSKNPNRTAPVGEDGPRADVPLCSRTNGWSWPPHPFQLLAWLLYVYFAVTGLGVFVPLLPAHWIPAGYICTGIAFAGHLCVHIMAVSVDPADLNVRTRSHKGPVPVFDRSKHAHVIENCHCYLCQVDVGPKSKHCSACNKCVANFDHHCRWLNNCVGSRNYKLFLHSVVSALLGVGLVLIVTSYVFVEFFLDPSKLRTDKYFLVRNETGVWYVFLPVAPVRAAAAVIPVVGAVTISLSLLTSVLLSHLLCFHVYLMWNRLSTYEYIVRQRHRQDSRKPAAMKGSTAPSIDFIKDVDYPVTLGFTNPQLEIEAPATAAAPGEAEFHANGRVRCASSPVMEEEVPPAIPPELNNAEHTHRHSQKKRKNVRKVLADVSRESRCSSGSQSQSLAPPPVDPTAQRLSFPQFPHRASLPPLAAATGPVLAAAPPDEYHSDSAESLDEIPVALARLGSSSSAAGRDTSLSSHKSASEVPQPSPRPRTKRKAASSRSSKGVGALQFEMVSSQQPAMFVSWASRDTARGPGVGHNLESVPRTGLVPGSRAASPQVSWTYR